MADFLDLFPDLVFPEPNTGCWLCVSNNNRHGYARLRANGRRIGAHRISYEISRGKVPAGLEIDHLCKVTCCVNPEHMEAVTHAENNSRMNADRARQNGYRCPNGHPRTADNIYLKPNGAKECRKCRLACSIRRAQRAALVASPPDTAVSP